MKTLKEHAEELQSNLEGASREDAHLHIIQALARYADERVCAYCDAQKAENG